MKVLFSARPAFGHVYPLLPLALAAHEAGHDVAIATTGHFLGVVERLGLRGHDVGTSIEEATAALAASVGGGVRVPSAEDGRSDPRMGARMFLDVLAPRTIADLGPVLAAGRPDIVVYEQYDVGAAVAAHLAGIPAVAHAISPRLPEELAAMLADPLAGLWAAHGVSEAPFDALTGELYLDLVPDRLQRASFIGHPARVPVRPVPFAEAGAVVPAWIGRTGRRLAYVTLGTMASSDERLRPVVEGLAMLDVDVLVALGSAPGTALGTLPANVHVEAFVDQVAVLRHAELTAHHGGSGTLLGAIASGTRQVLMPKGADQFFNAELAAAAGLAGVLPPSAATAEAVARAAAAELATTRTAPLAARAELAAMPHPADVVEVLVDHARRRSTAA